MPSAALPLLLLCVEAARPLLCQQGRRRHLCDSGVGRKGLSSAPGWGWMGQGVSSACLHPAGHIHAARLLCSLLSQHQNSSRKNQKNKKPTTHRWLRLWKALKEGLLPAPAARVPARCLLLPLPARLSLLAAVSHVRLPAHGRLAAPCRLLLASASSPLPWQLGPASSTQSPRRGGALPAAGEDGGGCCCDLERGD